MSLFLVTVVVRDRLTVSSDSSLKRLGIGWFSNPDDSPLDSKGDSNWRMANEWLFHRT